MSLLLDRFPGVAWRIWPCDQSDGTLRRCRICCTGGCASSVRSTSTCCHRVMRAARPGRTFRPGWPTPRQVNQLTLMTWPPTGSEPTRDFVPVVTVDGQPGMPAVLALPRGITAAAASPAGAWPGTIRSGRCRWRAEVPGHLAGLCRTAGEAHLTVSGSAVPPPDESSRATAPGRGSSGFSQGGTGCA